MLLWLIWILTDQPELRRSYSIPYLKFDFFLIKIDGFGSKFDTNGGFSISLEFRLKKLEQETRLTNAYTIEYRITCITNNNVLKKISVLIHSKLRRSLFTIVLYIYILYIYFLCFRILLLIYYKFISNLRHIKMFYTFSFISYEKFELIANEHILYFLFYFH